jgi:hypothetical protein
MPFQKLVAGYPAMQMSDLRPYCQALNCPALIQTDRNLAQHQTSPFAR